MNKNPTTTEQRAGKPARFKAPPALWRGRGALTAGGCRPNVVAGCRGWMSGLVAPIRYYGGFPPSLVETNVANATPLHPTAQGSALPPSPALLPRNATRGLGGVAFLPARIPRTKQMWLTRHPCIPPHKAQPCPPRPPCSPAMPRAGWAGWHSCPRASPTRRGWLSGLVVGVCGFPPPPPIPPKGGAPRPFARAQCPLLCLGGCRLVVGLGRLPSGCRG